MVSRSPSLSQENPARHGQEWETPAETPRNGFERRPPVIAKDLLFQPFRFDASLLPFGRLPPFHFGSSRRRPGVGGSSRGGRGRSRPSRTRIRVHTLTRLRLSLDRVGDTQIVTVRGKRWGHAGLLVESRRGQGDWEEIGILGGRAAWQPPFATPAPSPSAVGPKGANTGRGSLMGRRRFPGSGDRQSDGQFQDSRTDPRLVNPIHRAGDVSF